MNEQKMFHVPAGAGDAGEYCILPGDPGRCERIAACFDDFAFAGQNREFTLFSGHLDGKKVSVCSTGIGGPSAAIAMEELFLCGVRTFIRVGTCGGIAERVKSGDCIVASAAVRQDGTSREYAPVEFPAAADFAVVSALAEAAKVKKYVHHVGVVQSKDSFYGQHDPGRMPVASDLAEKWEAWKRLGVLGSEMECATLFTVAAALGARCGGVMHVVWNQERKLKGLYEEDAHDAGRAIVLAVDAVRLLIHNE
ncbi:MAG: uridine phosphorylase [Oscillospiraceae bacterium]|jgi:uridine phosphorylase|nr:uridine phosphorylase [Oscillospiraceae bacterium]